MKPNEHALIMAGGTGTRLWPLSRKAAPKQFQALVDGFSPLGRMYELLRSQFSPEQIWIQTERGFEQQVRDLIPELPETRLILEPECRDTAAAFGLGAATLLREDPEAVIGIFYSDHFIREAGTFAESIEAAYSAVEQRPETMVLIGVRPAFPHAGLGYIQTSTPTVDGAGIEPLHVASFVEKPSAEVASTLIESGAAFWNTGYKVFRADTFLSLLDRAEPGMTGELKEIAAHAAGSGAQRAEGDRRYSGLPKCSVEHLVTERAEGLMVVPCDMQWSDVGDWKSLFDLGQARSERGLVSSGAHIDLGSSNCLVHANGRVITTIGLKNTLVVDTGDALLVADLSEAQSVKQLVGLLAERGLTHLL